MNVEKISTIEEWSKEVEFALKEALSIHEDNIDSTDSINIVDIYKMASSIVAIFKKIESENIKNEMKELSWLNVLNAHEKIPVYKSKSKRCFVHAYLDCIIYLKLISVKNAEKVIDYLENKGTIESWTSV